MIFLYIRKLKKKRGTSYGNFKYKFVCATAIVLNEEDKIVEIFLKLCYKILYMGARFVTDRDRRRSVKALFNECHLLNKNLFLEAKADERAYTEVQRQLKLAPGDAPAINPNEDPIEVTSALLKLCCSTYKKNMELYEKMVYHLDSEPRIFEDDYEFWLAFVYNQMSKQFYWVESLHKDAQQRIDRTKHKKSLRGEVAKKICCNYENSTLEFINKNPLKFVRLPIPKPRGIWGPFDGA